MLPISLYQPCEWC